MNKSILTFAVVLSQFPAVMQAGCEQPSAAVNPAVEVKSSTDVAGNIPRQLFKINEATLEDSPVLSYICSVIDSLGKGGRLKEIRIKGFASPDGPSDFNRRLARARSEAMRDYIIRHCKLSPEIFKISSVGEDWEGLQESVEADERVPRREEILGILKSGEEPDVRERRLRNLGRASWSYLSEQILPGLRRVIVRAENDNTVQTITIETDTSRYHTEIMPVNTPAPEPIPEPEQEVISEPAPIVEEPPYEPWGLSLKTNVIGWAMGISNIQVELQADKHFSVMLPIYYSGWNYFRTTLKYRTFTILPEARYWFKNYGNGFFVDVHGGFSYYNIALSGDYRYQDHDGTTPALGGGIGAGYRFNFCNDKAWQMEVSVGYGIYSLDYDLFKNGHNGPLVGRRKRTFYGIDNAAVSFSYTFDLNRNRKKGGDR